MQISCLNSARFCQLPKNHAFLRTTIPHTILNLSFSALPSHGAQVAAECTFDRDACAWRNSSNGDFEWRLATLARRPANLPDKTFGAPVGYAYFDIFNTGSRYVRWKHASIHIV